MKNIDFSKLLAKHDLKITQARVSLLKLIEKENKPLDAQFLIDMLQKTSQVDKVTIFRILNVLSEHGILKRLEFGEGKARYELNTEDHHHLICQNCGKIEDISDCNISALEKEIKQKKHFLVRLHTLEFFGLCKDCQKVGN
ncbi:MAG TPA: Fur family transcriptional regulator [Candidatus Saccharimonadales bacterium]|nr:Fur family transcriptional regulator [Candidatus Saccharimonadales bacterium]